MSQAKAMQRRQTKVSLSKRHKSRIADLNQEKDKDLDPLQEMMAKAAAKQVSMQPESKTEEKKIKRKMKIGQKTIRVVKKPQASMMAMAMRQFFIKSLKKFLATGQMKSKYFYKFEILDVISPKCYIILPKSRSVQSESQTHQKFIFKQLESNSINIYCGTTNPTAAQVNSIIDPWINLVPKTPYIVTAYEVYRDYHLFMQMTEYVDGYDNVYNRLKKAKFGLLQESIPRQLIRMVYLFVIQMSHAFSYAHTGNLTHGKFDLTQALLDSTMTEYKITNFRPWLALGMDYAMTHDCESFGFRNLSPEQKYRIAKSRDLFAFGEAIYDLMLNKSDRGEKIQQQVVFRSGVGDTSTLSSIEKTLASKRNSMQVDRPSEPTQDIMPIMETIPLAWVQITEGATIIDILHHCMLVDTQRDTVKLFNHINRQATEAYQKFFDSSFKSLPLASSVTEEFMTYFRVAGLNNRAVMTQFKLMSHQLGKQVSELDNQVILDFQEKLFLHCVQMDPFNEEANVNLVLLLWKRGKIMDDQVCDEFFKRIEDRMTAQLLILAFRKANRYPIDPMFEYNVMRQDPSDSPLAAQILKMLKEIHASQSQSIAGLFGSSGTIGGHSSQKNSLIHPQQMQSMLTHITSCIPGSAQLQSANDDSGQKELLPQIDVKRIFFSKNEKFMVLITKIQAVVLKINPGRYECVGQFDLPKTIDFKNCDQNTLRSTLNQVNNKITRIDILQAVSMAKQGQSPIQLGGFEEEQLAQGLKIPGNPVIVPMPVLPGHSGTQMYPDQLLSPGSALNESCLSQIQDSKMRSSADISASAMSDCQEEMSTDNDVTQMRKRKQDKKGAQEEGETEEQAELRRLQKERECIGGGIMNTEWIAAIDNSGETLCLHSSASVQFIEKVVEDDNLSRDQSNRSDEGNAQDADTASDDRPVPQLVSTIHVYSGFKFLQHTKLQVGHLCPDEVLDLELDKQDAGGVYPSTDSFSMPETIEAYEKAEAAASKIRQVNNQNKILQQNGLTNFKTAIDDSPRFASSGSSSPVKIEPKKIIINSVDQQYSSSAAKNTNTGSFSNDGLNGRGSYHGEDLSVIQERNTTGPDVLFPNMDKLFIGSALVNTSAITTSGPLVSSNTTSFGRLAAIRYGLDKTINVKCKNAKSYDLAFTLDKTALAPNFPDVVLQCEPTDLPGGATIPTSLFRDPLCNYHQKDSKKEEKGPDPDERAQNDYKLLHYEHMREWLQSQELKGNIIKFSLLNSKYCIGFQRSTYRGMKPHFFIYEILKRKVIRRFLPMLDSFKQEWDSADNNQRGGGGYFDSKQKKGTNLNPVDSDLDSNSDNGNKEEEYVEDVSVFEVSPQGNFLVALVSNEFLTLKMLPRSCQVPYRKILTPSFMIEEHISMSIESDFKPYSSAQQSSQNSEINLMNPLKVEKDQDNNLFVMTDGHQQQKNIHGTSMSSEIMHKSVADQLISAFQSFEDFAGSTYYKHLKLFNYYSMMTEALKDTTALIYPTAPYDKDGFRNESQLSLNSAEMEAICKENVQILPKQLQKVLTAIKEYNFSYSVLTTQNQMLSGNIVSSNQFSKKVGVLNLKKLCVFDQIVFGRPNDKIKQILFSSFPRNWKVAVFFDRRLQVYDQITGQQIFELVCPSARKISFIDSENLIVVLEGQSQVFICSVSSQRQAFLNRELQVKRGEQPLVQQYEENQKFSQYTIGISVQRQDQDKRGLQSDQSENSENEEETIGIKVIVFDEVIKEMITSRNISPFGYLALIGETKLSIYLTYAEDDSCTYDHVWTINFWDLRKFKIGKRIELIDFSPNCEEFIAYTNTGDISLWSIKKMKFMKRLHTLRSNKQTPITHMRSFRNNQMCVAFSQPNNMLLILDNDTISTNGQTKIRSIRPESEGFGKLLSFQIDHSEQFLICTFSNDKVGIFNASTGQMVMLNDQPGMHCEGSFIDETGCFISMLDETKTKANIYVIEYKYDVEAPAQRHRMSTIESLDAPSEYGGLLMEGIKPKHHSKNLSNTQIHKVDPLMMRMLSHRTGQKIGQKERRARIIQEDKLKAAAEKAANSHYQKSKACTIF